MKPYRILSWVFSTRHSPEDHTRLFPSSPTDHPSNRLPRPLTTPDSLTASFPHPALRIAIFTLPSHSLRQDHLQISALTSHPSFNEASRVPSQLIEELSFRVRLMHLLYKQRQVIVGLDDLLEGGEMGFRIVEALELGRGRVGKRDADVVDCCRAARLDVGCVGTDGVV